MVAKHLKKPVANLVVVLFLLVGTAGTAHAVAIEAYVDNPVPVLNAISPNQKVAGDGAFTLVVEGTDFIPSSMVLWNGEALTTTFVGSSRLDAAVPSYLIYNEGTANVAVTSPVPGGGTSSTLPFTIALRTNTWMSHSPEGGIVYDLDIDASHPAVLYAGTSAAGIYKSTNGGQSWFAVNNGVDSPYINSVAISPTNPSIVLASSSAGTYLSKDGGAFWAKVIQTGASNSNCIKFSAQNSDLIYVASGSGLYRTTDGGKTWQDIVGDKFGDFPASYILQIAVDEQHPGTLYALNSPPDSNERSVWKTTNGGSSWAQITRSSNGLPASIVRSLEIDPSNPNVLYAGTEYKSGSTDVGLYRSENGGGTWTQIIADNMYYFEIVFNKGNPGSIYVSTQQGVYGSSDGGQTWQFQGSGSDVMTLQADPTNPSVLYGGGFHGIFKSIDAGSSWSPINTGLYAHLITALAYGPQNTLLFAATYTGGIWRSNDYGANWSYLGLSDGYLNKLVVDPNQSDHLVAASAQMFFESMDAGQSWTQIFLENPVQAITFSTNSDLYYASTDQKIYKSPDGGLTWTTKSTGLPGCSTTCWFTFLTADPVDSRLLYAGQQSGTYTQMGWTVTGSLYKTQDGGDHWTEIDIGTANDYLQTMAIDPTNRSILYLGTNDGVFKSTNGGATWAKSGSGLSYLQVNAIEVNPANNQIIYAGTEGQGVYRSLDGGATWAGFNYGMASGYVRGLVTIPAAVQEKVRSGSDLQTASAGDRLSRLYSISGGQVNAYFAAQYAPFSDVPDTYWAVAWIDRLYNAQITGGCSTSFLAYCPENAVTRAQMAVFLEKGLQYPATFSPSNIVPTFTDTAGHWAEDWIEALRSDGITGGCGPNLYCPEDAVTRAQMAVFLLKAKHGKSYTPPAVGASTGFIDVPTTHWAAPWIKQLAAEGITGGCGTGIYCPESPVTRAQMAVFLVKTFHLP